MEGQNKSNGVYETGNKDQLVANKRAIGSSETLLRVLATVLTLAAAIILGVDKQTKVVPVKILDSLPPMNVPVSAKWHYLSAFQYFVVANVIASSYAAFSLVLSLACRGGKKTGLLLVVFALDVVMVGLLFSSNGAAASIGFMGYEGNSHVRWNKVCNVFDKFCRQGMVALVVSLLGSIAFLLLVVLAAKRLSAVAK